MLDAPYPDEAIYMSQSGIAAIGTNNVYEGVYGLSPAIYNQPQKFMVDAAGGKFNIPLGIVRSGFTANDAYTISITSNTDTITKILAKGTFSYRTDPR